MLASSGLDLLLNFAPVTIRGDGPRISALPFRSAENVKELRQQYIDTHEVFVHDDQILAVAFNGVADIGATVTGYSAFPEQVKNRIAVRLLRRSLVRHLVSLGRTVLDFDPVTVIAAGREDDLLAASLRTGATKPPWISINPKYELSLRTLTKFLIQHPELTPEERSVVIEAIGLVASDEVDFNVPMEEQGAAVRQSFRLFQQRASIALPRPLLTAAFGMLGAAYASDSRATGQPPDSFVSPNAPPRQGDTCSCHIDPAFVDFCDQLSNPDDTCQITFPQCKQTTGGCGWLWLFICDGQCWTAPPPPDPDASASVAVDDGPDKR